MRRTTAALGLLAVLLGLVPGPGGPARAAPRGGDDRATFGVRPSGKKNPDGRPTFAYAATPGGIFTDQVEVSNAGTSALTLKVYASDAFNPPAGGFDLLAAGRPPADAGSWVTMSRAAVKVPARGRVIVPFTLRVPAGATPGDHAAGIVASLSTVKSDAQGNRVSVDQRVGARIYVRISGDLRPGLTVEGLTASFHPTLNPFGTSRTTLTYRVRNTGNVRLGARQRVTVGTLWGGDREAAGMAELPEILPGNAVDVAAEVPGAIPAFWLTSAVRADPVAQAGDQRLALSAVTRERGFWAVPWTLLGIAAAVAAVVLLRLRLRRRRPTAPVGDPHAA
jgi:hypothetical protein